MLNVFCCSGKQASGFVTRQAHVLVKQHSAFDYLLLFSLCAAPAVAVIHKEAIGGFDNRLAPSEVKQHCKFVSRLFNMCAAPAVAMLCREEAGGFDTRPAPFEVKQRVDRRRDRAMKLEMEPGEAGADGDRCGLALLLLLPPLRCTAMCKCNCRYVELNAYVLLSSLSALAHMADVYFWLLLLLLFTAGSTATPLSVTGSSTHPPTQVSIMLLLLLLLLLLLYVQVGLQP
jgi:hypothetical protein